MPPMKLLKCDPEETLTFVNIPNNSTPSKILRLTNQHKTNVAFKVKTTAPKAYLVRPSFGTLKPGESQEIQIILQPQQGDMSKDANNHRFLVQAVAIPNNEQVPRESWASFPKDEVQEHRLGVAVHQEAAAPEPRASSIPTDAPQNLKEEYDKLVQYTLMLEKEKKRLEADLNDLKGHASSGGDGFSKLTLIIAVMMAFLASYSAQFFSR
mmetsp:Transcript_121308/g.387650  ORF Transcript_121308/g.387650 Transcript_121308/m.387650 type:complete len:210 (-) Transcript_121308:138-767(-)